MKTTLLIILLLLFISIFSNAQKRGRYYKSGDQLPELKLEDAFGDSVSTSQLKGKKILLTFNRYVSCPLCNFRTHELLEHYDSLKTKGFIILSVYESSKETLYEYTSKEQIPFIMIADPTEKLYKMFKIRKSWWRTIRGRFTDYKRKHSAGKKMFKSEYDRDGSLNRIGADFLIDENGIIQTAYYGKYVGDHLPVAEIVKWVKK